MARVEWNPSKRWNPFNSYKLLTHVNKWKNIKRGEVIPAPHLVTVDPSNACNYSCVWCNAAQIRQKKSLLSKKALIEIADFLPRWGSEGVKAVCIAGGGEPLLNPNTGIFIEKLISNGIDVGVVTNGFYIDSFIESLSKCVWVGVSIDAGTEETYNKYKGSNSFLKVLDNIKVLSSYAKGSKNKLGWLNPSYGISYKYLLYKDNLKEIVQAAKIAKEIGCKNLHIRPAGTPWDEVVKGNYIEFNPEHIKIFDEQIKIAQELDDDNFGVYGVTHKFNSQFKVANYFCKCHALFMTAVFEPSILNADNFTLGLCCDRRGDKSLNLIENCSNIEIINSIWGSEKHWAIQDNLKIHEECPRCTYQPHNEIYEQVIINDSMTYNFI